MLGFYCTYSAKLRPLVVKQNKATLMRPSVCVCVLPVSALQEGPWGSVQVPPGQWDDDVPHEGRFLCPAHLPGLVLLVLTQVGLVAGLRRRDYQAASDRTQTHAEDPPLLRRVHLHASLAPRWDHAHGKPRPPSSRADLSGGTKRRAGGPSGQNFLQAVRCAKKRSSNWNQSQPGLISALCDVINSWTLINWPTAGQQQDNFVKIKKDEWIIINKLFFK